MKTPRARIPLAQLQAAFLECRDVGHAWQHAHDGEPIRHSGVVTFERHMWCPRCDTTRREVLHVFRSGHVQKVGVRYDYPEGYLLEVGSGGRQNVWREVLSRTGVLRSDDVDAV